MAITKQYWTALQIIDQVKDELDLREETFIDDVELVKYCNLAINNAEQQIIPIHVDYFLTSATLNIVSGTREYVLPADIYAHKIRRIIYENGSQVYKVTRIQDWKKFEQMAIEDVNNSATLYRYFLVNRSPGDPRINFVPVPFETGPFITVWYIRQANRFDDSHTVDANGIRTLTVPLDDPTNILDIPEAFNYIVEYVKMKCDIKERRMQGQMPLGEYPEVALELKNLMGALQEIVPDAENLIEADFSLYEEHS